MPITELNTQMKDELFLMLYRAWSNTAFADLRNYLTGPTQSESPDVVEYMNQYIDKVWPTSEQHPNALLVSLRKLADDADSRLHNKIPLTKLERQAKAMGYKLVKA